MMFGKNSGSRRVLEKIPPGSVGVEIGVWRGDTSEVFLQRAGHLHLVDPWSVDAYRDSAEFGGFREFLNRYRKLAGRSEAEFQDYYDRVYASVCRRFRGKPVTIHRKTSAEFLSEFDGPVDWFYIDGSHSYSGCLADIEGAISKTPRFIFGDDYGNKPGVTEAVDEIRSRGFQVTEYGANQYGICLDREAVPA